MKTGFLTFVCFVSFVIPVFSATTIDSTHNDAYGANIGWINFEQAYGQPVIDPATGASACPIVAAWLHLSFIKLRLTARWDRGIIAANLF